MLARILVVAFNSYREAVRARILMGLFALALATGGYSLIVGAYSLGNDLRVVSDLGGASLSIYGVAVAVLLGATSLHRELELKTLYPILTRPLRRSEYLVGKFLGTVGTVAAFISVNAGALLLALGAVAGDSLGRIAAAAALSVLLPALLAWRVPSLRLLSPFLVGTALLASGLLLSSTAGEHRVVLLGWALCAWLEVCIVTAVAMLFSSFSSPFLTAVMTVCVLIVGRSADVLAQLPERLFGGPTIPFLGKGLATILPNLMTYAPSRSLLLGRVAEVVPSTYLLLATLHAVLWSVGLLIASCGLFQRRDLV